MSSGDRVDTIDESGIAIIGMAGRFPKARNIEEFWANLKDGIEAVSVFSDQELEASGISPAVYNSPNYVRARAILEDIEMFDASFFGYSPREAEMMDPQQRIFLEHAWEALENAGYDPHRYDPPIGVFAGATQNSYILNVLTNPAYKGIVDAMQVRTANDRDYLPTRVSYKLNLRGPSLNVQTACSTSLVAVHLACQSLLSGECDMALAGGISINLPQKGGSFYIEGGIVAPDGHCRAFDAKAQGCVLGSGAGIVVLKRLEDALAGGDHIHAIIRGSAINNDGSVKAGFTAPSVSGQAEVVSEALAIAGIHPDTISFVEAHGTGTPVGDPVEIAALTEAFQAKTQRKNYCAIGTVKSNVGHMDAAAGVGGLIKTVLALEHKVIPPTLHFETPHPNINFANSPFFVNGNLRAWSPGPTPRRAGVSAFGLGGTNAHVIVEEAPDRESPKSEMSHHLLIMSAKTDSALNVITANLERHLDEQCDANLADIAHTLQVGRRHFNYRRMVVCRDTAGASLALSEPGRKRLLNSVVDGRNKPVVFMFPGVGSQYMNMGRALYRQLPAFRETFDTCSEMFQNESHYDLRKIVYPEDERAAEAGELFKQNAVLQPALFVVEYSLAKLLERFHIRPGAMIGHSFGEYVAACIAGVFTLKEALSLIYLRGQLCDQLPAGAMLSAGLPEDEMRSLLSEDLSLACVNGPSQCVVSGEPQAIEEMTELLAGRGIQYRRLHAPKAFHSHMVAPIMKAFGAFVRSMRLYAPTIPYISNVTGTWIGSAEATDPDYWVRHLRQTVRFSDGIKLLLGDQHNELIEVGPATALSTLVRAQSNSAQKRSVHSAMRHPLEEEPDLSVFLNLLGRLWLAGARIDWDAVYSHELRRRTPLPTYPFERRPYWVEPAKRLKPASAAQPSVVERKEDVGEWFYIPSWKRSMPPKPLEPDDSFGQTQNWLVFRDEFGVGDALIRRLERAGQVAVAVRAGTQLEVSDAGTFTIDPRQGADYDRLLNQLVAAEIAPHRIIHLWTLDPNDSHAAGVGFFQECQDRGYYSLLYLAQAIDKHRLADPIEITVVSNNIAGLTCDETVHPEKTAVLGPCKVIPQEYEEVSCRFIDISMPRQAKGRDIDQLLAEVLSGSSDRVIAYRGNQRWVQCFENVRLEAGGEQVRPLRPGGAYVIVGGLGQVGFLLAQYLAREVGARVALIVRTTMPAKEEWGEWVASHGESDPTSRKIRKGEELKKLGAEFIILTADVTSGEQMRAVLDEASQRWGRIDGLIYAAYDSRDKSLTNTLTGIGRAESERQFQPKVYGLYVLKEVLKGRKLDWCLLLSSNASILGGMGFFSYSAANQFMDAFAAECNKESDTVWISSNWDGFLLRDQPERVMRTSFDVYGMTPKESAEAFRRIVTMALVDQVVVSATDLNDRLAHWVNMPSLAGSRKVGARPDDKQVAALVSAADASPNMQAPGNEIEQAIAGLWRELLGVAEVDIEDNFFELGGDSLLATRLFARIRDNFQITLPLRSIFDKPTISQLGELCEQILVSEVEAIPEHEAQRLVNG